MEAINLQICLRSTSCLPGSEEWSNRLLPVLVQSTPHAVVIFGPISYSNRESAPVTVILTNHCEQASIRLTSVEIWFTSAALLWIVLDFGVSWTPRLYIELIKAARASTPVDMDLQKN